MKRKSCRILCLLLCICMIFAQMPVTGLAFSLPADDTSNEDTDSGIKLEQTDYTDGVLTVRISGKLSEASGFLSARILLSFDNTVLTLMHKSSDTLYAGTEGAKTEGLTAAVAPLLENVNDAEYGVQDATIYRSGDRTGFLTFIYTTQPPNDSQKVADYVAICDLRFAVEGSPASLDDVLDQDSLRFALWDLDETVIAGAYTDNDFSVGLTTYDETEEHYKYFGATPDSPDLAENHKYIGASVTYDGSETQALGELTMASITGISVAKDSQTSTAPTVTATDVYGGSMTVPTLSYSFSPETEPTGVTYNTTNGTIAVASTAQTGSVTVTATGGGKTASQSIAITRAAAAADSVSISGGDTSILVPADGESANTSTAFAAAVSDQFGATMSGETVTWAISTTTTGITITSAGVVTVTNDAKSAITDTTGVEYTVTATVSGTSISDTATIIVKRDTSTATTLSITETANGSTLGDDLSLLIPMTGSTATTFAAQTLDQYGESITEDYTWTLTPGGEDEKVTFADSTITVGSDATPNETYTLKAVGDTSALEKEVDLKVVTVEVDWSSIVAKSSITYGDSKRSAFTTLPTTGTASALGTSLAGTFSIVDPDDFLTPAGDKKITVKFTVTTSGAYSGVEITKVYTLTSVAKKAVTVTADNKTRIYGDGDPAFAITVPTGALVTGDAEADLGVTLKTTATAASDVGSYDIEADTLTSAKYAVTVTKGTLSVTKATLQLSASSATKDILANDTTNNASAVALLAYINAEYGGAKTVSYSLPNAGGTKNADVNYTFSITSGTFNPKGGTYVSTAAITPADSTNFSVTGGPVTVTLTVKPVTATATWTTLTLLKAKAQVNDAANYAALGLPTTVAVSYDNSVTGGPYDISGWSQTMDYLKGIDVSSGDKAVTLTPTVDFPVWATVANLNDLKTVLTITSKYPVTVTVTAPADVTYGTPLGDPANSPQQAEIDGKGVEDNPDWTYLYVGTTKANVAYSDTAKPTQAGTYKLRATLVSDTHAGTGESAEFEIAQKALDNAMVDVTGSYQYTGKPVTPSYTVEDGDLLKASDYTAALTNNLNAGNGTITVTATATGNYKNSASAQFAIGKADALTIPGIVREYNKDTGAANEMIDLSLFLPADRGTTTFDGFLKIGGDEVLNSFDLDEVMGIFEFTTVTGDAGAIHYKVTATMQNYADTEIFFSITLVDKAIPFAGTAAAASGDLTYGQKLSAISVSGAMQVSDADDTGVPGNFAWENPDNIPNAGNDVSVGWVFTPTDTATYTSVSGTVTIDVAKATPAGTPTYTAVSASGKTLKDAAIAGSFTNTNSGAYVDGALTWDDGEQTEVAMNTAYSWTFTPTNTNNYNVKQGSITPWVYSSSGGGTSSGGGSTTTTDNTVVVDVTPTVSGDTATVSVTEDAIANIVNNAEPGTEKVVFEIDVPASVTEVAATFPTAALQGLADSDISEVTISSPVGNITLDSSALSAIASSATGGDVTISIEMVDPGSLSPELREIVGENPVFDLSVLSGDVVISSFGDGSVAVSVPYTLKAGESGENLVAWNVGDDGTLTQIKNVSFENGMFTFVTNHFSYYMIEYNPIAAWANPFDDVSESAWYYENVRYANVNGLMNGVSATAFDPNGTTTRGMIVTILWRLEGEPAAGAHGFSDVAEGKWYASAVAWAAESKVVEGLGDGLFAPDDPITREQLATMLYRYAELKGYNVEEGGDLSSFSDAGEVSDWANTAMSWAVLNELVVGSDNKLSPQGNAERAQVAAVMQRLIEKFGG